MAGYLPPGCTQRKCDEAQPGYWDPPQQWFVCDACDGSGVFARRVTVYEHGCGFPHDDTAEEPCGGCNGVGGWLDDAHADAEAVP
jgi:hypothetical protein